MTNFQDILEYEELIDWSIDCAILRNATMLKDFGPLKEGEEHFDIMFDFVNFECRVINEDEEETHSFKINLTA